jgi:hypothetical protein
MSSYQVVFSGEQLVQMQILLRRDLAEHVAALALWTKVADAEFKAGLQAEIDCTGGILELIDDAVIRGMWKVG